MKDSIEYQIVLNDKTYRCKGYSEIQLVVPKEWYTRKPKHERGFWDKLLELDRKDHYKKETINILKIDAIKVDKPIPLRESYVTVIRQEEKISEVLEDKKNSTVYVISKESHQLIYHALYSLDRYTHKVYNNKRNGYDGTWLISKGEREYYQWCLEFANHLDEQLKRVYQYYGCKWERKSEPDVYGKNFSGETVIMHHAAKMDVFLCNEKIPDDDMQGDFVIVPDQNDLINAVNQFVKQRQEREEEKKRLHEELLRNMGEYASRIITGFDEGRLLSQQALPIMKKVEEYKKCHDFCVQYLPEIDNLDWLIDDCQEGYIDKSGYERFKANWNNLNRSIATLSSGLEGEQAVARSLDLLSDKLVYLRNYHWECEHDFIILMPNGIFTVEVKTISDNCIISETGRVMRLSKSGKKYGENVAEQSMIHVETLRKKLKDCPAYSEHVPIREIICSANDRFTFKSNFPEIPVCYPTTIRYVLFPDSTYSNQSQSPVLSWDAIQELKNYLIIHQEKGSEFNLFAPKGEISSRSEFIKDFAAIAAAVKFAKKDDASSRYKRYYLR